MKNKKHWLYLLQAFIGAISIYVGGFVLLDEDWKVVSGMCIGLGAAFFSLGLGNFVIGMIIPETRAKEIKRIQDIEVNDERNIRIRDKVGAKINHVVVYALSLIVLAMGLLQTPLIAILMVASVFLLELILSIVLSNYYAKRM